MAEIYYDEISVVAVLVEDGAVDKLTALLMDKYEISKPYLPYVGPDEFWDLVTPELAHQIRKGIGERYHPNLTLCWILRDVPGSPLLALQDVADDSNTIQIFDPNFTQHPNDFYWTLLTRDFIQHVLDSDSITPYAVKKLDTLLKDNKIEYEMDVPVIDTPSEEELIPLFFVGLIRIAEKNPDIFNHEIKTLLNEEGFDPTMFNSETIKAMLHKTKSVLGLPNNL